MSELFNTLKSEILSRAKIANACNSEYRRAANSENIADLLQVVKDNFHFCYVNKVVDPALIEQYKTLFNSEKIYVNVDVTEGFLLASGNATVKASDNATVKAYDNATVEAYGNATVEAYGNATVKAYGNATVKASGNATVEAYGNATVEASDNATVEASDNAYVTSYTTIEVTLNDNSIYRVRETNTVYYASEAIKFSKR